MFLEIGLREVSADVEEAYGEHDARELERDGVLYRGRRAPRAWVEYVETVRPDEDPEGCTEDDFADVQLGRRWVSVMLVRCWELCVPSPLRAGS